jgi:hypothetical protein
MAVINYLNPGDELSSADWLALWEEADSVLAQKRNNQAAFLFPEFVYDRVFFFCASVNPAAPATMAQMAISLYADSGFNKRAYTDAVFDNWVMAAAVDSGGTPPYKEDWPPYYGRAGGVIRLVAPSQEEWVNTLSPAIWPESAQPVSEQRSNLLNHSLKVQTKVVDGLAYNVFVSGGSVAEYVHWWDPAEIVLGDNVGAAFTWPLAYDKFRLLRFNNLQPIEVTITLPTMANWEESTPLTVTIPPMQSQCVRATGYGPSRGWVISGRYFHRPLALDPWWLKRGANCNITDPLRVAGQLCPEVVGHPYDHELVDWTKVWDVSGIYNGVEVPGDSRHIAAPAGGWFGAVSQSTMLGDMLFHRGKLMAVNPGDQFKITRTPAQMVTVTYPPTVVLLNKADGTAAMSVQDVTVTRVHDGLAIPQQADSENINWVATLRDPPAQSDIALFVRTTGPTPRLAVGDVVSVVFTYAAEDKRYLFDYTGIENLASALGAVGATIVETTTYGVSGCLQITTPTEIDLVGLTTNLITLACGAPGIDLNGGNAFIPPFALYDQPLFTLALADAVPTDYGYYAWTLTGTDLSTLALGTWTTVSITSMPGYNYASFPTNCGPWSMYKNLGNVIEDIQGADWGSGVTVSVQVISTVFGPGLLLTQQLPVTWPVPALAPGGFDGYERVRAWQFVTLTGGAVVLQRTIFHPLSVYVGVTLDTINRTDWAAWTNASGGSPERTDFQPLRYYPRTPKAIGRLRCWNPNNDANVLGLSKRSVQAFFQEYFESKPFGENHPIAISSQPLTGIGEQLIEGIGFLQGFDINQVPDIWLRLAAWVNYGKVFRCPPSGEFIEDFSKGSAAQEGYWASAGGAVLSAGSMAPGDDDSMSGSGAGSGKVAVAMLPMAVEHFNAVASLVNGVDRYSRDDEETSAQSGLLTYLERNIGAGIGFSQYRPRNQFAGWQAGGENDATAWATSMGLTVLTAASFPGDWAALATTNARYFDGATYTDLDPLFDQWAGYYGTSHQEVDNYRWVTIADAQALYARLGARFRMCETVCPGTFLIQDATVELIGGTAGLVGSEGGRFETRAMGWWNDASGDWVFSPDSCSQYGLVGDTTGIIMRSNVSRTDYALGANFDYGIFRLSFGAVGLDQRMYQVGVGGGGPPTGLMQMIVANRFVLYRRYGMAPATAVIWPRNYCDWERDVSSRAEDAAARMVLDGGGFRTIQRIARSNLEGVNPEMYDLEGDEQVITTGLGNGMLVIWPLNSVEA